MKVNFSENFSYNVFFFRIGCVRGSILRKRKMEIHTNTNKSVIIVRSLLVHFSVAKIFKNQAFKKISVAKTFIFLSLFAKISVAKNNVAIINVYRVGHYIEEPQR